MDIPLRLWRMAIRQARGKPPSRRVVTRRGSGNRALGLRYIHTFFSVVTLRPDFLSARRFLCGFLQCLMSLSRSRMIITANGTDVTSNITNPMYSAPAASATFFGGRTDPSSAKQLRYLLVYTIAFSWNKTKIPVIAYRPGWRLSNKIKLFSERWQPKRRKHKEPFKYVIDSKFILIKLLY